MDHNLTSLPLIDIEFIFSFFLLLIIAEEVFAYILCTRASILQGKSVI